VLALGNLCNHVELTIICYFRQGKNTLSWGQGMTATSTKQSLCYSDGDDGEGTDVGS
jgi:hypothetical protein